MVDVGIGLSDGKCMKDAPLRRETAEDFAHLDLAQSTEIPGDAVGGQRGAAPEPGHM